MPWCTTCEAYRAPSAVRRDGTCPKCGAVVDAGRLATTTKRLPPPDLADDEEPLPPVPWHLKVLGVALALYLGVRAWQGIEWLIDAVG